MIAICFGMPRSASTTLWLMVSRLAEEECRQANVPFTQLFWSPGQLPADGPGITVLKLHGAPTAEHLAALQSGSAIAIGSHRNIPDVVASLLRVQAIDPRFAASIGQEQAGAESEYDAYTRWVDAGGLGFSFDDITTSQQYVAEAICNRYGWSRPFGYVFERGEFHR